MNLNTLSKIKSKSAKRVGRGGGSGKGKTSGRGTKGQNARGKISIFHSHFEGGQRPLFKRLPYKRGKGNRIVNNKPIIINLKDLNNLPNGSKVDLELLIKNRIVDEKDAKRYGVKILGKGDLKQSIEIAIPISKRALAKINKSKK